MIESSFKSSQVGTIPNDWEIVLLSKFAKLINGRAYAMHEWEKSGIPVIRLQNLTGNTSNYYYSNLALPIKNYCDFGDLLYMWSATFGPVIWKGTKAIYHYHIWKIETETDFLLKGYLYYKLQDATELLKRTSSNGGTMLHVTKGFMDSMPIALPPLPEQKAIAEALSDTDVWIESLEQLIAKKRLIKQGAMQDLLRPKEGWELRRLGEVISVFRGGSPRPIQDFMTNRSDGINWIKIGDTTDSAKYILSASEKIIPEGSKMSRSVSVGDFLLSNSMSFGRPYILKIDGCIHDGWLVMQNYSSTFDIEFLYYLLSSKFVLDQYLSKAAGSSVLNLNKELVKSINLFCPPKSEQIQIAYILSDIDSELENLENQLSKARQIKQGMMQDLLTGRIRLI